MKIGHILGFSPFHLLPPLTFAAVAFFASVGQAEPNWPILKFVPVEEESSLYFNVDIQNAADGSNRLFVVQQTGLIQILKDGTMATAPFLDISSRVAFHGEQGLLGLAFPPDFSTKQCFYVYYTRPGNGNVVLSRFRVSEDPDVADPQTEEILMVIGKFYPNHNGGQIAFGPDGLLYIAVGDGGNSGDPHRYAQDLTSLLGKILRIDVENVAEGQPYSIPDSNPFAGHERYRPEILLWGLRNPWRFSFDSLTGDMFLADVGESSREEINFIPADSLNAGANFGWSLKEGSLNFQDHEDDEILGVLQPPIFEYDRSSGHSITGGHIYRGGNPRLKGFYFFGDFMSGRLWAMQHPQDGGQAQLLAELPYLISTFGKDESGEIYVADYAGGIYRIDCEDTVPPPVISPGGGLHTDGVACLIWSSVPGAVVRYTTDGSDPDESSPIFVSAIQITEPQTVKARAFRSDLNPSEVAEATFELRPATVQIVTPPGRVDGYYTEHVSIALRVTTPGAEIRYTLDGSIPTQTSLLYSEETPIFLQKTTTVRAVAFKPGWQPSATAQGSILLRAAPATLRSPWPELHEPVDLTSLTANAVIHYTIDGTAPTLASPVWVGPQDIPAGTTIRTLSARGEMNTGSATLKVVRISSQKAIFYRMGLLPTSMEDVVRVSDTTFYAVGGYQLWKVVNGTSTRVHSGGISQNLRTITLAPDAKLIVADQGTSSVSYYLPPTYSQTNRWQASPTAVVDAALEPGGSLLLADANHRIRRITASSSTTIVAGTGVAGSQNGPAAQATFNDPIAIARDAAGNVFVAEKNGRRVRKLSPDNVVSTLAGTGVQGWQDGPHATAKFETPRAMTRDRIGNIYISDRSGSLGQIRKIRPDGIVTTLRGPVILQSNGSLIASEALGTLAPSGLDVDENGVLYFVDSGSSVCKVVQEDWDNDGIPDAIETVIGTPYVVGIDDRFVDSDGDEVSNAAEWISGTSAADPAKFPRTSRVVLLDADTTAFSLPCATGTPYQLEYSDNLKSWKPMGTPFISPFRTFTAVDRRNPSIPDRFYRLRETAP